MRKGSRRLLKQKIRVISETKREQQGNHWDHSRQEVQLRNQVQTLSLKLKPEERKRSGAVFDGYHHCACGFCGDWSFQEGEVWVLPEYLEEDWRVWDQSGAEHAWGVVWLEEEVAEDTREDGSLILFDSHYYDQM